MGGFEGGLHGGEGELDTEAAFLSLLGENEFSIDKAARILGESRGTVAHRLKGICLEQLVRSKGDIYKASLALSGGRPESLNRVRQRMEEYYGNLLNVIQQYENAEAAITECRRRFKNLKGKYFTAVEDLVKRHFEKNKEI
jgi:predicted transcriptional regulator